MPLNDFIDSRGSIREALIETLKAEMKGYLHDAAPFFVEQCLENATPRLEEDTGLIVFYLMFSGGVRVGETSQELDFAIGRSKDGVTILLADKDRKMPDWEVRTVKIHDKDSDALIGDRKLWNTYRIQGAILELARSFLTQNPWYDRAVYNR